MPGLHRPGAAPDPVSRSVAVLPRQCWRILRRESGDARLVEHLLGEGGSAGSRARRDCEGRIRAQGPGAIDMRGLRRSDRRGRRICRAGPIERSAHPRSRSHRDLGSCWRPPAAAAVRQRCGPCLRQGRSRSSGENSSPFRIPSQSARSSRQSHSSGQSCPVTTRRRFGHCAPSADHPTESRCRRLCAPRRHHELSEAPPTRDPPLPGVGRVPEVRLEPSI